MCLYIIRYLHRFLAPEGSGYCYLQYPSNVIRVVETLGVIPSSSNKLQYTPNADPLSQEQ